MSLMSLGDLLQPINEFLFLNAKCEIEKKKKRWKFEQINNPKKSFPFFL